MTDHDGHEPMSEHPEFQGKASQSTHCAEFICRGTELLRAGPLEITDFGRSAEIGIAYSVTFNYPGTHAIYFLIIDAVNGQILSVNGN